MSDIKSVVTGKDCPHMKEKSALKQNKVGNSLSEVAYGLFYFLNSVPILISFSAAVAFNVC